MTLNHKSPKNARLWERVLLHQNETIACFQQSVENKSARLCAKQNESRTEAE